jgi:hypothetical protein
VDFNEEEEEIPLQIKRKRFMRGTLNPIPKVLVTYIVPKQQFQK